ncbi:MAG: PDZ domain-containing protein [Chloroflexi bacterium]|nr:MAG: PDZ domain-containing protein [Chloroflexota bacterium]
MLGKTCARPTPTNLNKLLRTVIDPEGAESPPEAPAGNRRTGATVALVVIAAIVSGAVSAGVTLAVLRFQSRTNPQTVDLGSNVRITEDSAIIQVATKASPAVATIVTNDSASGPRLGSGFVTTSDGYLVTNAHVVANASGLSVLFAGESARRDARLVDSDCRTDLAVLKVDGVANLPTLAFGDPAALKIGESVVAVGTPLGLRAAGRGIISSLHQPITVSDPVVPSGSLTIADTIQTDVQTDSRSSGGPLLNVAGQVVGVNVEADSVRDGSLVVPDLGVETLQMTSADAALRGVPVGSLVSGIVAKGPAEAAGVKTGDVITAVDEVKIDDAHPLGQVLASSFRPGQRVSLTLSRQGSSTQVQATLGRQHPSCG